MAVIIVLLLLEIYRGRRHWHAWGRRRRVIEGVPCLFAFGVNRITVGIYRTCEVNLSTSRWVWACRCLDPSVRPGCLLRLGRVLVWLLCVCGLLNIHRKVAVIVCRTLVIVPIARLICLRRVLSWLGWRDWSN